MVELLFRVYLRTGRSGKKTWSARFFDSDGTVVKTKSLPSATNERQAERQARELLRQGVVADKSDPIVRTYLEAFWKLDSDYAGLKALHGHPLSDRYVSDNLNALKNHLFGHLENRRINTALKALAVAVKYYCRTNRIPNPIEGTQSIAETHKPRQILTQSEMAGLIQVEESIRAKAAVLLAAFCGLRAGEVRGLQWSDVQWDVPGEDPCLLIRHNYVTDREGLKRPKWHKDRPVPLPEVVVSVLRAVEAENLNKSPYVLFNESRNDRPLERCTLTRGFHRVLAKLGIDEAARKERNLCFHGLRNLFVSYSRSVGIPDYVVQRMVGHSTLEMTDHYTRVNVTDFSAALAKLNGGPVSGLEAAQGAR